jgi:hypothetical protein
MLLRELLRLDQALPGLPAFAEPVCDFWGIDLEPSSSSIGTGVAINGHALFGFPVDSLQVPVHEACELFRGDVTTYAAQSRIHVFADWRDWRSRQSAFYQLSIDLRRQRLGQTVAGKILQYANAEVSQ